MIEIAPEEEKPRDLKREMQMMKIGDVIRHGGYHYTKVPGGWIVRFEGPHFDPAAPVAMVFVPSVGIA